MKYVGKDGLIINGSEVWHEGNFNPDNKANFTHNHNEKYVRYIDLTVNTARTTAEKLSEEPIVFEDGVIYNVLFTDGTSVASPTLNGVPIMLGATAANTTVLSIAAATPTVVPMRYDGTRNRLNLLGSHRTSDSVESYTIRWTGAGIIAGAEITQRKLIMMGADNKFYPLVIGNSTGVNNKTISNEEFLINSPILVNYSTTTFAKDAVVTATSVYAEVNLSTNFRYSQNIQSGWIANAPMYLKGIITSNGKFKLAGAGTISGDYMTQTLPISDDGYIYILLGFMGTTTTTLRLIHQHPIYEFKDGKLRLYIPEHKHDSDYEPKNTNIQSHISNTSNPHSVTKSQVGLGNVDNTSDLNKPISTATQTALNLKANLASPTFTGTPKAPTATVGTNTTQIATTAFVQNALSTGGYGDMLKATYDINNNGKVDIAEVAETVVGNEIQLGGRFKIVYNDIEDSLDVEVI